MKVTTLLLVVAAPTAIAFGSDRLDPAASPNAWVHPQYGYEYQKRCSESGVSEEVCACAAKHILVGSPPSEPLFAPEAPGASQTIHHGYRESCERWAGLLGLVDEDEAAIADVGS